MGAERIPIPNHAGFWRRGNSVCFKYRDARRRQRWGSAPTLKAAKRKRSQLETDIGRGEYQPVSRETFRSYARSWIETFEGRTSKVITSATRKSYRRRLEEEAIPYFGDMLLTEIRPQHIKAFVRHVAQRSRRGERYGTWAGGDLTCRHTRLREGSRGRYLSPGRCACGARYERDLEPVSQNTVRLALAPVKAMFATAFEEGVIRVNPAAGVRIVVPRAHELIDEEDEGLVKALSETEIARVMAEIPNRWRLFFHVLVHLGLRISEAIELRWRDVDLGTNSVRIRRKFYDGEVGPPKSTYGRRSLKLTDEVSAALWELRKQTRARDGDLVFTSVRGCRIDASNLMGDVLKPAALAAGVGWANFHTFRHTCATLLFTKAEWNPKQVQLWLGHHSPSFTIERYVHLLPDDLPAPVQLTLLVLEQAQGLDTRVEAAAQ